MSSHDTDNQGKYSDVATAAKIAEADDPIETVARMEVEGMVFAKGELQEPAYRDKWFGIAFWAHLITMLTVACMYASGKLETDWGIEDANRRMLSWVGERMLEDSSYNYDTASSAAANNTDDAVDDKDAVKFLSNFVLSLLVAPALSLLAMSFMRRNAVLLIQSSLYFAIGFNAILAIVLFLVNPLAGIWPAILAFILVAYTKAVWHRIPFAAANLKSAITCVQANMGMVALAVGNIPVVAAWVLTWGYVAQCIFNSPWMKSQEHEVEATDDFNGVSNQHEEEQLTAEGTMAMLGIMLSFYWTLQVARNVVHTSLAGTVGTWWFSPEEASSCCSRGLTDSWCRSMTYSFGSICLGSLIVAIIEVLKSWLRSTSRNRRAGLLRIIAECLLVWVERIAEYFNKWAFIYVGLYGYSYVEAGKNVFSLFRNRGWTTIINDSLVVRMLGMMSFSIGLITALISVLFSLLELPDPFVIGMSALFALLAGMVLSSLVFGVLISATDSIIVLYAEAPSEFLANHPDLAHEMEATWSQAWPDIFTPSVVPTANVV